MAWRCLCCPLTGPCLSRGQRPRSLPGPLPGLQLHPPGAACEPTCSGLSLDHLGAGLLDSTGEGGELVLRKVHLRGALQGEAVGTGEQGPAPGTSQVPRPPCPSPGSPGIAAVGAQELYRKI